MIDENTPKYVGDQNPRNTMTLTIEPSAPMIQNMGIIRLFTPGWYEKYDNFELIEEYPFD